MMTIKKLWQKLSVSILLLKYKLRYASLNIQTYWYEIINPSYMNFIQKSDVEPIFIVGCGRSGNTLLARVLHESGNVCFSPENFTLWEVYNLYLKNIKKSWNEKVDLVIDKLFSQKDNFRWNKVDVDKLKSALYQTEEQTLGNIIDKWYASYNKKVNYPSLRWGCKTPNLTPHSHKFLKVFPNMKIVYIVRKPSDVIASFMKANILDRNSVELFIVIWRFFNAYVFRRLRRVSVIIDYDNLVSNKDAIAKIYQKLDLENGSFQTFDNEDIQYAHLNNVNGEIQKKNSHIHEQRFTDYDRYYERKLKVLSDV